MPVIIAWSGFNLKFLAMIQFVVSQGRQVFFATKMDDYGKITGAKKMPDAVRQNEILP
jgi:hypothetical protein